MSIRTAAVCAVAFMGIGTAAIAEQGTIENLKSPVMINQGAEYVPASEGMTVHEGDQLIALQGGAAQLNFASGCSVTLGGNELLRVSQDICTMPANAAINAQVQPPPANNGGSGAGSAWTTGDKAGLVATMAVTGKAGYEILQDNDKDQSPISQ